MNVQSKMNRAGVAGKHLFSRAMGQATEPATGLGSGTRSAPGLLRAAGLAAAIGVGVGLAAFPLSALAQPAKEPLDVNKVVPTKPEPPKRPENTVGTKGNIAPADATPKAANPDGAPAPLNDSVVFTISRFILTYHAPHDDHPPTEYLLDTKVRLGVTGDGYVAPPVGHEPGVSTVDIRIGDVNEGGEQRFHFSALKAIQQALVEELRDYGLIAVWVQFDPEEVGLDGSNQPADFRAGKHQTINMIMWTGKATQVRTIATGERLNVDGPQRINNPDTVHQRIRENSPVQPGDLLWRDEIDDYVFRLNRHPGRRVDVAVSATGGPDNPEGAGIDYLVSENKPWSVYAQISNTGTKSTDEWRERFGFTHNQLTGHDDILRVDWITAGFSKANAVNGSYDRPIFGDRVRGKVFGSYSDFRAGDVGQAAATFKGQTYGAGAEATWNFFQHGSWFGDAIGGIRYENVALKDNTLGVDARDDFLIPYVGTRFERVTDRSITAFGVSVERSLGRIPDSYPVLNDVGRRNADDDWWVLKYDLSESFYIEPLINGWMGAGKNGKLPMPQTLAHELAFSFRGQYVPFNKRLIANEEEVAGGLYSVRGYDESIGAGDTVFIGSAEYRFHVPRALGISDPGYFGKKKVSMFGPDFRSTPQGEYGTADWDMILRGFTDVGKTRNNNRLIGENNLTLWSVGVGAELQWRRNVSVRLDWGFPLRGVNDNGNQTHSGDSKLHFSMTLLY